MNIIKEIEVRNYSEDNTPIIRVFDDGTSYLLADDFEDIFSNDDFEEELSELLGVEVDQEDREVISIDTNDMMLIEKLRTYLEEKRMD